MAGVLSRAEMLMRRDLPAFGLAAWTPIIKDIGLKLE